jgi:hypothetical protein
MNRIQFEEIRLQSTFWISDDSCRTSSELEREVEEVADDRPLVFGRHMKRTLVEEISRTLDGCLEMKSRTRGRWIGRMSVAYWMAWGLLLASDW